MNEQQMIGMHAVLNGALISAAEATVPVTDRAVQYGFSTYESIRVVGGHPVHLSDHLLRLQKSCEGIGLVHPFSSAQIERWVGALIAADAISDATIRIQLYGGDHPMLFILASAMLTYPEQYYRDGVGATTYRGERLIPSCKTGNLLLNYMALADANRRGNFEALLVDRHGHILEGTRSNFFAFRDGVLYTARDGEVLLGITREQVIRAAAKLSIPVVYEAVQVEDLFAGLYDELFISATSMAAMPLSHVDGMSFLGSYRRTLAIKDLVRSWEMGEGQ
ncbi:MAG TPA: aminotransferase class IV [Sphaerochaeta sp.]|jgi:branched-chain amino acid aminotransferase|nr:aminotransferase class IV [Sphaerochaeta sp.]HOQ94437.1 aminotransferase class IV [Sphaerochaeta sp.]